MRDFAYHEAQSRRAYGNLTMLVRVFKNWRERRGVRALLRMDDYMLRDIGLSRDDLNLLLRRPLSLDTHWEAERLRLISSKEWR